MRSAFHHRLPQSSAGYTILEMLVSLFLFGVMSSGVAVFVAHTLQDMARESRLAEGTDNIRQAMQLMATELKNSSNVSPYLPGNDPDLVRCGSELQVSDNSISFLIVHDDNWAQNGLQPYRVSYLYDPDQTTLYRTVIWGVGGIQGVSRCQDPGGNPFESWMLEPVAENVVRIDADNDGSLDPVFQVQGSEVIVTLGVEVFGSAREDLLQEYQTAIAFRGI